MFSLRGGEVFLFVVYNHVRCFCWTAFSTVEVCLHRLLYVVSRIEWPMYKLHVFFIFLGLIVRKFLFRTIFATNILKITAFFSGALLNKNDTFEPCKTVGVHFRCLLFTPRSEAREADAWSVWQRECHRRERTRGHVRTAEPEGGGVSPLFAKMFRNWGLYVNLSICIQPNLLERTTSPSAFKFASEAHEI